MAEDRGAVNPYRTNAKPQDDDGDELSGEIHAFLHSWAPLLVVPQFECINPVRCARGGLRFHVGPCLLEEGR